MAQNGMFRNAFRGFHKQDVLQYIDEITAAWNEERKALEQTASDAVAAQEVLQAAADEAQAQAAAATEQQQAAEAQLTEAQQKLTDTTADLTVAATTIEEMATQLEEAQRRIAQLERELSATADERDTAIAALADAKAQLTASEDTARQLEESRRQVGRQNDQIAQMRQTIDRYESVVGNVDTIHEKVSGIVRPYIEQTAAKADERLHDTHNFLTGLICQLSEINDHLSGLRDEIRQNAADSNDRVGAALSEWCDSAQSISGNSRQFFP